MLFNSFCQLAYLDHIYCNDCSIRAYIFHFICCFVFMLTFISLFSVFLLSSDLSVVFLSVSLNGFFSDCSSCYIYITYHRLVVSSFCQFQWNIEILPYFLLCLFTLLVQYIIVLLSLHTFRTTLVSVKIFASTIKHNLENLREEKLIVFTHILLAVFFLPDDLRFLLLLFPVCLKNILLPFF